MTNASFIETESTEFVACCHAVRGIGCCTNGPLAGNLGGVEKNPFVFEVLALQVEVNGGRIRRRRRPLQEGREQAPRPNGLVVWVEHRERRVRL